MANKNMKKYSTLFIIQFSSVAQSCPTLCDHLNRSTPGLPVHHQLPEFTQTHVHRVGDAIQPSHPLLSPFSSCPQSLPASESFPMSQLCMRWPKYWSFSFSIIPSKEIPYTSLKMFMHLYHLLFIYVLRNTAANLM